MHPTDPAQTAYRAIAFLAVIAGMIGMAASALFLDSKDPPRTIAGASGFLAGAVLIGSGMIATAVLHATPRGEA